MSYLVLKCNVFIDLMLEFSMHLTVIMKSHDTSVIQLIKRENVPKLWKICKIN